MTTLTTAHAALSAQTANTIQGTAPYLKLSNGTALTNLNQLLGFSMPDGGGGKLQIDASMSGTTIAAPSGMKYQDVIALITADGNSHNVSGVTIDDNDGDALITSNASASGTMMATWYNGGVKVNNLNSTLSVCGGPYKLVISANNVAVDTSYGDPNNRFYGTRSETYTFTSTGQGICYIRPGSMNVYDGRSYCGYPANGTSPSSNGRCKWEGGYNPAVWVASKGFSVNLMDIAGVKFPTTGFRGAKFGLVGSGTDQRVYRCSSSDNGAKILLSDSGGSVGKNCMVTYRSATKAAFTAGGTPTINMEYSADNGTTWTLVDSYTIPVPAKWAIGKGQLAYKNDNNVNSNGVFPGANACAGYNLGTISPTIAGSYFFQRNELTNSPYADIPLPTAVEGGYLSRDVDGTFMGEWGYIHYSGSPWEFSGVTRYGYWVSEASSVNGKQFSVYLGGMIYHNPIINSGAIIVICRG